MTTWTDPNKSPGPGYFWSGIQGTWIKGKTKGKPKKKYNRDTAQMPGGISKSFKPKTPGGSGKNWQPSVKVQRAEAKSANKGAASDYIKNRLASDKRRTDAARKAGTLGSGTTSHPSSTRGASTGGAGSSRSRSGGIVGQSGYQGGMDWAKVAFRKIVKEHPEGIDFAALRRADKHWKGNKSSSNNDKVAALHLPKNVDWAALKRADTNKKANMVKRSGPQ